MKNKYLVLILISSCNLLSCSNFLDTEASDFYNEDNWWKTEDQVISTINGCYTVLKSGGVYNFREDNLTPNSYGMSTDIQLAQGTHNAGNYDDFKSKWDACYRGIGRVNYLLDNIDKIEMSENLKNRIKGEATFLRAFFYFNLVNYYSGVPLILEAPKTEHGTLPRNSKQEVLTQIFKDLDNAISSLPTSYSNVDFGRATKGAALSLKTRIHLYESDWKSAENTALEIINLNIYKLFPKYRELFMPENENNSEVIFDIQYKKPEFTHSVDISLESQMGMAPTLDMVNSYLMIDGKTIDNSDLFDPDNPYENRDPRLHQTIVVPGYMYLGKITSEGKYYSTGFGFKKYTTYKDDVSEPQNPRSDLNFILMRYADVLLMFAEARNETSGPDKLVYDALNQIRNRVNMPEIPSGLNKEQMREVIRLERRIELAGESLYYNDIRRWKTAEMVMNDDALNIKGEVVQKRTFKPNRDYLWPIHEITIQENPNLKQNDNY